MRIIETVYRVYDLKGHCYSRKDISNGAETRFPISVSVFFVDIR